MFRKTSFGLGLAIAAGALAQQSATVTLNGPANAAPGDEITITAVASYDLDGAAGGVFGSGIAVHGGSVDVGGSATGTFVGKDNSLNGAFAFLPTLGSNASAAAMDIGAATGLDPAVTDNPANLFSYKIEVPSDATGELELTYNGAVVLTQGDDLNTFSTNPGLNQFPLTTPTLTITIGAAGPAGCNAADLNGDFNNDGLDVGAFLAAYNPADPNCTGVAGSPCNAADLNADGNNDGLDVGAFLGAYNPADPVCDGDPNN